MDTLSDDLLMSKKDLRHLKPMQFGITNEPAAVECFEKKPTGFKADKYELFVLSENQYIGASPDRIIVDKGLKNTVKVKCR